MTLAALCLLVHAIPRIYFFPPTDKSLITVFMSIERANVLLKLMLEVLIYIFTLIICKIS